MSTFWEIGRPSPKDDDSDPSGDPPLSPSDAEAILSELASTYAKDMPNSPGAFHHFVERLDEKPVSEQQLPNVEAKYRALVEQLPAVVFMAYLDRGIGEAYVSPQFEATLGFSQAEWLGDPVLWYQQIHPDDKPRWSIEASEMFLSGKPLRSAYRVIARNGRVILFQCEAKMIRRPDGSPWFIHGLPSTLRTSSRPRKNCRKSAMSFRGFSIPWVRWWLCSIAKDGSCASTAPASR